MQNLTILLVSRVSRYVYGHNEDDEPKPIAYFDKLLTELAEPEFLKQFKAAYINTACNFQASNQVYLIRPIPEMGIHVPITLEEYHQRHAFTWAMQDEAAEKCGVKILNPLPYLCDDTYCYGSKNGRPLYYDDDHLSEYGNKFLVPMFEEVFQTN